MFPQGSEIREGSIRQSTLESTSYSQSKLGRFGFDGNVCDLSERWMKRMRFRDVELARSKVLEKFSWKSEGVQLVGQSSLGRRRVGRHDTTVD